MQINMYRWLVTREMARRAGVGDTAAANRLALVGSMLPSPVMGVVVTLKSPAVR